MCATMSVPPPRTPPSRSSSSRAREDGSTLPRRRCADLVRARRLHRRAAMPVLDGRADRAKHPRSLGGADAPVQPVLGDEELLRLAWIALAAGPLRRRTGPSRPGRAVVLRDDEGVRVSIDRADMREHASVTASPRAPPVADRASPCLQQLDEIPLGLVALPQLGEMSCVRLALNHAPAQRPHPLEHAPARFLAPLPRRP